MPTGSHIAPDGVWHTSELALARGISSKVVNGIVGAPGYLDVNANPTYTSSIAPSPGDQRRWAILPSLATHVKHPNAIMDERCYTLDKFLRPYYISS
jgi:hypothetical protein